VSGRVLFGEHFTAFLFSSDPKASRLSFFEFYNALPFRDHQTKTFHPFISPTARQSRFLQVDGTKSVRLALVLGRQPMRLLFVFGPSHRTAAPKNCTWIEPAKVLSTPHITPQTIALRCRIKAKYLVRCHNSKATRCLLSAIYTRFLAFWMNASRGERLFGAVFSLCG
jgi:hypothetical protein